MHKLLLAFAVLAFAACSQPKPEPAPVVTNIDNKPAPNQKPLVDWALSQEWLLFMYRSKEGKDFDYVATEKITIRDKSISFPIDCNGCQTEIEIDRAQNILRRVGQTATCTKMMCGFDEGPAKSPVPFSQFKEFKLRRDGGYLVLSDDKGEFWLRRAPSEAEQAPDRLENTAWQIIQYDEIAKGGAPKYVAAPMHVSFGDKYISVSPDCNACTSRETAISYANNKISWKGELMYGCTEMACLDAPEPPFRAEVISNGSSYAYEDGLLVVTTDKYKLYLRRFFTE